MNKNISKMLKIESLFLVGLLTLSLVSTLATSSSETPSSWTDVTSNWSSESGVQSNGGSYASNSASGGTIIYYDFDVQIPNDAYVVVNQVYLDWYVDDGNDDTLSVYFSDDYGTSWCGGHTVSTGGSWEQDTVNCTHHSWGHITISYAKFKVKLVHNQVGTIDTIKIDELEQTVVYEGGPPTLSPTPSSNCKNPSNYNGGTNWANETQAYGKRGSNPGYTACTKNEYNVTYYSYDWDVHTGGAPQGVRVYIHWKAVVDDKLKVSIQWDRGSSAWQTLDSQTAWAVDIVNFTTSPLWTPDQLNGNDLRVTLQKDIQNADDAILVDWVGTLVEFYDVRVEDINCTSSYKGTNQSIGFKFKNYGDISVSSTIYAKIKVNALNYTDYNVWINKEFTFSIILGPGETTSAFAYSDLPYIFQGYSDPLCESWIGWFAMNIGVFNITDAYVYTSTWNMSASIPSGELYSVNSSSTHRIFVVPIVLDDLPSSTPTSHFDGIENNNSLRIYNVSSSSWEQETFGDYFDTEFILKTFISDNETSGIKYSGSYDSPNATYYTRFAEELAQDVLGLSSRWANGNGWDPSGKGTYTSNHGFDLLVVYTNSSTIMYDPPDDNITYRGARGWQNTILNNNPGFDARAMLHELIHTYLDNGSSVEHLNSSQIPIYSMWGFIMGGSPTWYMHPDILLWLSARIDHYEGVD